jgi:hypothetical protein
MGLIFLYYLYSNESPLLLRQLFKFIISLCIIGLRRFPGF